MGKDSAIEWTDHTFNPWWGCVKVSQGCANCYANSLASRFGHDVWGTDKPRRLFKQKHWYEPIKWNRAARKEGKPARVFCGSMCDVFERHGDSHYDADVLDLERMELWELIEDTPRLIWLLLTKRPENITDKVPLEWLAEGMPPNVWFGVSVENQDAAYKRIPPLLDINARVRFLSIEPLINNVSLDCVMWTGKEYVAPLTGKRYPTAVRPTDGSDWPWLGHAIDWVIVGGESGPEARPMNPEWARNLRDVCQKYGTPFFMKQMSRKGSIPDDLMIRGFPNVTF